MRRRLAWGSLCLIAALIALMIGCGSTSSSTPRYNSRGTDNSSPSGSDSTSEGGRTSGGPTSASDIPESDFLLGIRVNPTDLAASRFSGNWEELAQWVSGQGWNHITVYAVEPTDSPDDAAQFFFPDVTFGDSTKLSEKGFSKGASFESLVAAAEPLDVTISADITRLALSLPGAPFTPDPLPGEELSAEQIGEICTALCRDVKVDSVCGSFLPDDWAEAAMAACRAESKQFISGDGLAQASASLLSSSGVSLFPRSTDDMAFKLLSFAAAGQDARQISAGIAFGHDYESDSPFFAAWRSQQEAQNALKFQAIMAQPTGFVLDLPLDDIETVPQDLMESLREYARIVRDRDVCNFILVGAPAKGQPSVAAAVNGILAAGYSIAFSREPMAEADAFYILAYPQVEAEKTVDLPESIVGLLGDQTRRVLVQVAGVLPAVGEATGWDAVRRHCGLDSTDYAALEGPPKAATLDGFGFPWGAEASGNGQWGSAITAGNVTANAIAFVGSTGAVQTRARTSAEAGDEAYSGDAASAEATASGKTAAPRDEEEPAADEAPDVSAKSGDPADGAEEAATERETETSDAPVDAGEPADGKPAGPAPELEAGAIVLMTVSEVGTSGAMVFINGVTLDLQAAFPISKALSGGGGLQAPTTALVTASERITAFLAANGDTEVNIKIGGPGAETVTKAMKAGEIEIIESDEPRPTEALRGVERPGNTASALPGPA